MPPPPVTDGLANRDIAAQFYLSPRTVEYHPREVFKHRISSRTELVRGLPHHSPGQVRGRLARAPCPRSAKPGAPGPATGTGGITDATSGPRRDGERMQTGTPGFLGRGDAMQIMIIDDHEISRAAFRALLRAEGADVVADLRASAHALAAVSALRPEVVLVDVTPAADTGFSIARKLRALPTPPMVILTSSADRAHFGAKINGYWFIAKADISSTVIASLASTREQARPNPGTPAKRSPPP
jgi:FixJ family two-component response regulator